MPQCSCAQNFPVEPPPVWTSSTWKAQPCWSDKRLTSQTIILNLLNFTLAIWFSKFNKADNHHFLANVASSITLVLLTVAFKTTLSRGCQAGQGSKVMTTLKHWQWGVEGFHGLVVPNCQQVVHHWTQRLNLQDPEGPAGGQLPCEHLPVLDHQGPIAQGSLWMVHCSAQQPVPITAISVRGKGLIEACKPVLHRKRFNLFGGLGEGRGIPL